MKWIQLTAKQARLLYAIPAEIANAVENKFFGVSVDLPYGYDNLRPLAALLEVVPDNKALPDVATLFIKTIHPESWEDDKGMLFNPFSTTIGGYLSLDKEGAAGLIGILSAYQEQLSSPSSKRQMFRNLEDSKIKEYRLHPEWFPNTKQEYYVQVYDPLTGISMDSVATILNFSRTIGFSTVFLKIMQFEMHELYASEFLPLDSGQSRVDLDRNGFQELIELLQKEVVRL